MTAASRHNRRGDFADLDMPTPVTGQRRLEGVVGPRSHPSYTKRYRLYVARTGAPVRIDAEPTRRHLSRWIAAGWNTGQIAAASGVSRKAIELILAGCRTVHPTIATALCKSQPGLDSVHQQSHIDALGSARRLRALAALGHPVVAMPKALDVGLSTVQRIIGGQQEQVTVSTATAIRRLYDKWSMTPGPSSRARTIARKHGWAPPLAWDEDEIDNPAARPHRVRRDEEAA